MKSQRWVAALAFIAAALALSAAAVQYVRSGEIELGITAAGVFPLAMGHGPAETAQGRGSGHAPAGALTALANASDAVVQHHTESCRRLARVVVDQAFAVAAEQLDVPRSLANSGNAH